MINKNKASYIKLLCFFSFLISFNSISLNAQNNAVPPVPPSPPATDKKWYDVIGLRGYAQIRYNRLLETNPKLKCEQCDRSIGDKGGFFIRRARLIFSGNVTPRIFIYIQPDIASSASTNNLHFLQIRDAYFDIGLNPKNTLKLRLGQSKVIYGFENLQSSQNRLTIDRSDALNSGVANERDLGATLYYSPEKIKKRFASLVKDGLKGSGDYGMLAVAVYNGQIANRPEINNNRHFAARVAYPFLIKSQIIEAGMHVYTGSYTLASDQMSPSTKTVSGATYGDKRLSAHFILYPQPFGLQFEYTIGKGPQFDTATDSIRERNLKGGFVNVFCKTKAGSKTLIPYVRYQYYDGGKKHELDARSYIVKETEMGCEVQFNSNLEVTMAYTISNRRFEDFQNQNNQQKGNFLRLQTQINF